MGPAIGSFGRSGQEFRSGLLYLGLTRYLMAVRVLEWLAFRNEWKPQNMALRKLLLSTCFCLFGKSLYAHPGHGVNPVANEPWHYLLAPQHALFWVSVACLSYLAYRVMRRPIQSCRVQSKSNGLSG
jgi:hypothetical protein